jgi:hypothetical protein
LLQNENGPCPLLAAANALLLNGSISFPAHCVAHNLATLEDVANLLVNQAMQLHGDNDQHIHFVSELLESIPTFQFGMDVNPKFTATGAYEYTAQLAAFDMMRVKLVHGWLVEPGSDEAQVIGKDTYNQLVERIIKGQEANEQLEKLTTELARLQNNQEKPVDILCNEDNVRDPKLLMTDLQRQHEQLSRLVNDGSTIDNFLQSSANQLTRRGLQQLLQDLHDDEMTVFFRNNHFGTLTKFDGHLYLLVTDLGYADAPDIVWERLDELRGNTVLVNSQFVEERAARAANLTAQQHDADYQMAVQMSLQTTAFGDDVFDKTSSVQAETEAEFRGYQRKQLMTTSQQVAAVSVPVAALPGTQPPALPTATIVQLPQSSFTAVSHSTPTTMVQLPQSSPAETKLSTPAKGTASAAHDHDSDIMLAMQLQGDINGADAINNSNEDASLRLARQLQAEENQRAAQRRPTRKPASKQDGACVIS